MKHLQSHINFCMNREIGCLLHCLIAMATVVSSYGGNITVNWSAGDLTGVALAGSGNEYGIVNGVPCGNLIEIGTFTNAMVLDVAMAGMDSGSPRQPPTMQGLP
jgi:hypothetical protein